MKDKVKHIDEVNRLLNSFAPDKIDIKVKAEHFDRIEEIESERNEILLGILSILRTNSK